MSGPVDEALNVPTVGPEQVEAVARLLPPALRPDFDARFRRSHDLFDEFVYRLALQVVRDTGLAAAAEEGGTAAEIAARAGLAGGPVTVPVGWLLRHLARRGVLAEENGAGGPRFRATRALPVLDPAVVEAEQRRHQPACLPSYALAQTAARDYPAFLRGERTGEEILLAPSRLPLWTGYFSNDNTLYAVNNRVGAVAVATWMSPAASILELGGGLASGAAAVLDHLTAVGRLADVRAYRFTELVPPFLRRGQAWLQRRFPAAPLAFGPLDMNQPFEDQGVAPGSVSIVYAVNTLHVAHDLAATLGEVRRALAPDGQLVIVECVRPRPGQTIYPEFVFNLLETFRAPRLHPAYRPNGGFLTPEQWTAALEAAGLEDVRALPDVTQVREAHPDFYVGAFAARRGGTGSIN